MLKYGSVVYAINPCVVTYIYTTKQSQRIHQKGSNIAPTTRALGYRVGPAYFFPWCASHSSKLAYVGMLGLPKNLQSCRVQSSCHSLCWQTNSSKFHLPKETCGYVRIA